MVNLGEVITEREKEHFKPHPPMEEGWYKTCPFIADKTSEPTPYRLLFDFLIGGGMGGLESFMQGGTTVSAGGLLPTIMKIIPMFTDMPPFLILIETKHPTRGREHVRFRLSPLAIVEGPPEPNIEPDLILRIDYYDLVRLFLGELGFIDPFCDGLATIDGNMSVFLQFQDMFESLSSLLEQFGLTGGEGEAKVSDIASILGSSTERK